MNLVYFIHEKFGDIRATEENGITWFVGIDVCNALGYKNARKAINDHVNNADRNTVTIRYGIQRGNPNMITINESGLYSLIMSSKLPSAKEFKHWVTSEVLPSLRKTGHYDMGNQSNSVFNSINKLEDHAINGSARSTLNDLIMLGLTPNPCSCSRLENYYDEMDELEEEEDEDNE